MFVLPREKGESWRDALIRLTSQSAEELRCAKLRLLHVQLNIDRDISKEGGEGEAHPHDLELRDRWHTKVAELDEAVRNPSKQNLRAVALFDWLCSYGADPREVATDVVRRLDLMQLTELVYIKSRAIACRVDWRHWGVSVRLIRATRELCDPTVLDGGTVRTNRLVITFAMLSLSIEWIRPHPVRHVIGAAYAGKLPS